MKIITWMVRIIVLLILVWLALQNNQTVVFSLMDGVKSKSCCKFTLSNPSQLTN